MPPASQHVRRLCEGSMSPSLGLNEEQKQKLKHIQANTLGKSCQFIFRTRNCSSIFGKHQPANSEASKAAEPPDWRCHHVHPELSELELLIIRGTTISAGHDDYGGGYPYCPTDQSGLTTPGLM